MNQSLPSPKSPGFLFLTVSVITCLTLLINVSFKIIQVHGMIFSVNSLICPLITGIYLVALRRCTAKEQRHLLNISVMSLYLFCIGVYVLVNLPASEYMHDNPVYEIIFDDIPKKFFATTIAFALSFYLPHLLFCTKPGKVLSSPRRCMLLALFGGLSFFTLDFFLLFSGNHIQCFKHLLVDSTMIASLLLLSIGIIYLTVSLKYQNQVRTPLTAERTRFSFLLFLFSRSKRSKFLLSDEQYALGLDKEVFPLCYYLICFAVVVMLICLACEYRIVTFIGHNGVLAASALFFPITLIIGTLIGELWGYRVNLSLCVVLIASQFIFDTLLMGIVALPSPDFFNLNPFYSYIMLRRLPAASLTLFATFMSNAMLLYYLKQWGLQRPLRILIANICANSLLCLIDYSLLFGGIYAYDQIINLVANVWSYKLVMTLLSLPFILKLCSYLEKNKALALHVSV